MDKTLLKCYYQPSYGGGGGMPLTNGDLQAIADLMDSKLSDLKADTESKLTNLETNLKEYIGNSIHESECVMLDEMERYNNKYEEKFNKIDKRFESLEETVKTIKLEHDIVNILVKHINDLEKRISIIENKIALNSN